MLEKDELALICDFLSGGTTVISLHNYIFLRKTKSDKC